MHKALSDRWTKAQALVRNGYVERWGVGYRVRSSRGGWYYVRVRFDSQGRLCYAQCTCPDHGVVYYRGVPVCKHCLAVALYVYLQGGY